MTTLIKNGTVVSATGAVLVPECNVDIPADRIAEAAATAAEIGAIADHYPFVEGAGATTRGELLARQALSDAGPELHAASRVGFAPPDEWPATERAVVETDQPDWERAVEELAAKLRTPRSRDPSEGGAR